MNKLKGMAILVISLVMVFCMSGIVYASEVDTSDNDRKVVESLKQHMQAAKCNTIVEAKNDDILKPELIEAYNDYLQQNAIDSINDINTIIEFVDFAVDKGMIEDTVEVQNAITKALVRLSFKAVVTGGRVLGYGFAAELLGHSLQDNPARMSYSRGSTQSNQIENSNEFKQLISNIKSQLDKTTRDIWTQTGSTTLNSTTDLFLALNKVSYTAGAEKLMALGLFI